MQCCLCYGVYESRCGKLFEDMRKAYFVGRYEYPEILHGACELLVHTSRCFGGNILRGGRHILLSTCSTDSMTKNWIMLKT